MENKSNENNTSVVQHEKKKKDKMVLWIVIIALLGVNVVLLYNLMQKTDQLVITEDSLAETEAERAKLDSMYDEGLKMIALLERDTTRLNDELKEKLAIIKLQNEEIDKVRRQKNIQISQLRSQVSKLKQERDQVYAELDELKKDNEYLREMNTELLSIRREQVEKIDELTTEKKQLQSKVNIASKLEAREFTVVGINERNNGKERETRRNTAVDKLKITFKLAKNYVVESGPKEFYIKINQPNGSTLAIDGEGSGTFTYDGVESLYTVSYTHDYDVNDDPVITVYWGMNNEFPEGDYKCELYEGGYLIGETTFSLR